MVALVAEIGPVKATAITYVNPAVAIIAGAVVLGERVTVWTIVGFVLVLLGSYLVTRRRIEPIAAEGPEEACAEQPQPERTAGSLRDRAGE
jgi:drug/metabolite transporter (DMT)-like permease